MYKNLSYMDIIFQPVIRALEYLAPSHIILAEKIFQLAIHKLSCAYIDRKKAEFYIDAILKAERRNIGSLNGNT